MLFKKFLYRTDNWINEGSGWIVELIECQYIKACVRYFSLFLKEKCISSLFRTKHIEKKFNLQLFFFSSFHEHSFSLELPPAGRLLKTSCLEERTACVIEATLMT